jgi:hypothetical protein
MTVDKIVNIFNNLQLTADGNGQIWTTFEG